MRQSLKVVVIQAGTGVPRGTSMWMILPFAPEMCSSILLDILTDPETSDLLNASTNICGNLMVSVPDQIDVV